MPEIWDKIQNEVKHFNNAAEENRKRFLQFQGKTDNNPLRKNETLRNLQAVTSTTLHIGVLLVEFNDLLHHSSPTPYSKSNFVDMLFSNDSYNGYNKHPENEQVFGSLNDWYEVQSHSELSITGNIINSGSNSSPRWIKLGNSSNYPAVYGGVAAPTNLVVDAINAAIDSGWTVNQSGAFVIMVIVAGGNNDLYRTGVGYPRSYFSSSAFDPGFNWTNWLGAPVFHERSGDASGGGIVNFTHIGIWCHELGHVIGSGLLGGLQYHPEGEASDWSAMRTGYRTGPSRKYECPANFDPPAIISFGWASPINITNSMLAETIDYINNKSETKDFYQFSDPEPFSTRMFILENRQYSDFNYYLPEWHVSGTHGGIIFWEWASSSSNSRTIRPGDNDFDDIGAPYWQDGDGGDPFPGFSDNRTISMITTPNTNIGTRRTGFAIRNISTTSNSMIVDLYPNFWTGNITTNESWNYLRNPYIVGGTLTVLSPGTLTIESNTIVQIDSPLLISSGNYIRQPNVTFNPDIRLLNGTTLKGQYPTIQSAMADATSSDQISICSNITVTGTFNLACNILIDSGASVTFENSTTTLNGKSIRVVNGTIVTSNATFSPDIRLRQGTIKKGFFLGQQQQCNLPVAMIWLKSIAVIPGTPVLPLFVIS